MLPDQDRKFGKIFIFLALESNVEVNRMGIGVHFSLCLGERYHRPLRNTFRKVISEHPDMVRKLAVAFAVKAMKAMNDTLETESIVSSAVIFG